jgi:hypothetical protein
MLIPAAFNVADSLFFLYLSIGMNFDSLMLKSIITASITVVSFLSDENDKPIFNSEIVIDVNDNVSVLLTNGRLLDFDKPTKLIAFFTETQQPKADLKVDFTDATVCQNLFLIE